MLMLKLVTILSLLVSASSFSQTRDQSNDKAFQFYMKEQYDSAIHYYQKLVLDSSSENVTYLHQQLGKCFFMVKNYKKAEEQYLLSLGSIDSVPNYYPPLRYSCLGLADLYITTGSFEKSLKFLQLAEKSYPYRNWCGRGSFERKLLLADKFSICFENLNLIDSAISYLTPFMFADTAILSMDIVTYLSICKRYVMLLNKVYSSNTLKSMIECALENVYYKKESAKERGDKYTFGEMYFVNCHFTFLDSRIILENGGYEAKSWGGEPVLYFTKQYIISRLELSPTYQMLLK